MDLAGGKIKPAEGYLAVRFVDDDAEEAAPKGSTYDGAAPQPAMDYEGCLAIVAAVGAKVSVKVGDTIVTRAYARDGVKFGAGLVLIDNYCVLATIA